jgi:hypothetical protein
MEGKTHVHRQVQSNEIRPIGQVETPPQVLLVYTVHLVMIAHAFSAADTLCKGVKNLLKVGMYSSNSLHRALSKFENFSGTLHSVS